MVLFFVCGCWRGCLVQQPPNRVSFTGRCDVGGFTSFGHSPKITQQVLKHARRIGGVGGVGG
jgi:hypothetical protein